MLVSSGWRRRGPQRAGVGHGDNDDHGDGVGDGNDTSQGGYGDGTLEGSGRGDTSHAGGQEALACRFEVEESLGEARHWK
jgi:hypothetical protein